MGWRELSERFRSSPRTILAVVYLALLLDNVLVTVVVPIIPDYLLDLEAEAEVEALEDEFYHYYWNDTDALNLTYLGLFPFNNQSRRHDGGNATGSNARSPHSGFPVVPEQLMNENSRVGWLFSSKAMVQLAVNPFIGPITNRYGSSRPLFSGFVILMISTMLYAFGESYAVLFAARAVHGLSSSLTAIAGLSLLADTYPDDIKRSRAMGIALGGIALGVLIGYPYGGFMYDYYGKMIPFLIIAVVTLLQGALQLWVLEPNFATEKPVTGTSLHILLQDPYILIASGAILFPEMAMAMLEPTLPIWLLETMNPAKWQLGTVFIPDSIGYLVGTNAFGVVAHKMGRWLCTIFSLVLMGICLACIPFATHISHLIVPHFGLGLALGVADVSIMPLLALLVERRHVAVYGSVYAIAQVSISLGFAIGPSLGGQIVKKIGFPWLIRGMALANIIYCPVCYLLKSPPTKDENKSILMHDHNKPYTEEDNFTYRRLDEE